MRDYIKEQQDTAQAKIDVAEGGIIAMALAPVLMGITTIIGLITM